MMLVKRITREGKERRGGNVDEAIQAIVRDLECEDKACQIDHKVREMEGRLGVAKNEGIIGVNIGGMAEKRKQRSADRYNERSTETQRNEIEKGNEEGRNVSISPTCHAQASP